MKKIELRAKNIKQKHNLTVYIYRQTQKIILDEKKCNYL